MIPADSCWTWNITRLWFVSGDDSAIHGVSLGMFECRIVNYTFPTLTLINSQKTSKLIAYRSNEKNIVFTPGSVAVLKLLTGLGSQVGLGATATILNATAFSGIFLRLWRCDFSNHILHTVS